MRQAAATGAYAPLLELLAAPFRAVVISQLPLTGPGVGWETHPERRAVTAT
jgi:hypothetical protein